MKTILWTAIGAITCAVLMPERGFAQSGDATPALEEIIVTAQKREQSFNDVGLAVSVFSADEIRELRFFKPEDVAAQTPT